MSARFEDQLPPQLVEDLRWVQDLIAEHPERFTMSDWMTGGSSPCNSAGCIAGHIACKRMPEAEVKRAFALDSLVPTLEKLYELGDVSESIIETTAEAHVAFINLVEAWQSQFIPEHLHEQIDVLFHLVLWPKQFLVQSSNKYRVATTTPELAIDRIDYFLEHGK